MNTRAYVAELPARSCSSRSASRDGPHRDLPARDPELDEARVVARRARDSADARRDPPRRGAIHRLSVNPARSIGPALVGGDLSSLWIYLVAPILGAVVAALVYRAVNTETEAARST